MASASAQKDKILRLRSSWIWVPRIPRSNPALESSRKKVYSPLWKPEWDGFLPDLNRESNCIPHPLSLRQCEVTPTGSPSRNRIYLLRALLSKSFLFSAEKAVGSPPHHFSNPEFWELLFPPWRNGGSERLTRDHTCSAGVLLINLSLQCS